MRHPRTPLARGLHRTLRELCRRLRVPVGPTAWWSTSSLRPGLVWRLGGHWSITAPAERGDTIGKIVANRADVDGLPRPTTDPLQAARWALRVVQRGRG